MKEIVKNAFKLDEKKNGIVVLKKGSSKTRFSKFGQDGCCVYR